MSGGLAAAEPVLAELDGIEACPEGELAHYGVKRRSGRYPWGSGDEPFQHEADFIARVDELKRSGMSEKDIAESLEMSTTEMRMALRVAKHERDAQLRSRARELKEKGLNTSQIAREMGYKNESSVRALLNEQTAANKGRAWGTADTLVKELEKKGQIDVGRGTETILGCSAGTLNEALYILQGKGYEVYGVNVEQPTNKGKYTTTKVLVPPGTEYADVYKNIANTRMVGEWHSDDGGTTYRPMERPSSLDSSRVHVRYGDEGGSAKDGVIELRRGVADLDLGAAHYAQVRIMVDGTHYLKGMAMYSDDIPAGCDVVFNTNKKSGTPKADVFKKVTGDPDNPFGAAITAAGQSHYKGADGKERLSPVNKLKEEGEWERMSKNLSSQFLSKQPIALIKKQLGLTYDTYEADYEDLLKLSNPTVRKKMLLDFAESCDSAAQHMKAAALPRQTTQVILPLDKIREDEVYAPNYRNGEQLALVRYPHGGTFEIPVVTVNNHDPSGRRCIGPTVRDAIGIHPKVAERLSGADFDGDQVIAIPTNNGRVKVQTTRTLKGLEGFDPKAEYPHVKGARVMPESSKQREMGAVSNLITDMTLKGANADEIARAVRHSMVVIDAVKHKLDYKQSEVDNGIAELKAEYQGRVDPETGKRSGGASTLISRRKQDVSVPERQGSPRIDPETGEVSWRESGRTYVSGKTGEVTPAQQRVKLVRETKDLHSLSSGTLPEIAYAEYGNKMKALANRARKEAVATPNLVHDRRAAAKYKEEVASLGAKLNAYLKNAPRERQAQILANAEVKAKRDANPGMDKSEVQKLKNMAMMNARAKVGASGKNVRIYITDGEWEAIQAGAVSHTTLHKILQHADSDRVRELATPRAKSSLPDFKVAKLKIMANSGSYTNQEIADVLGCSVSTVSRYLNA